MHPLPVVRSPTPIMPPLSPFSSEGEDLEELTPDTVGTEFGNDLTSPPPPPQGMISLAAYEWVVGRLTADLAATEASLEESRLQRAAAESRLAESRFQLAAERDARLTSQGGRRNPTPRQMRREIRRIEGRARLRLRSLQTHRGRLVDRRDAEIMFRGAMMRVRDVTRTTRDP